MKIVIPGGTGQIGAALAQHFGKQGHDVVIVSRTPTSIARHVQWDGQALGDWAKEIDGADVVINLAGRTVNCRYSETNLQQMMSSRVDSTRVVGVAIAAASSPPPLWLQMSTATIYAHRFDTANDEASGIIGGNEPDVPSYWARSVEIAKQWEQTLAQANTPHTRKVALRTAMVMGPARATRGGVNSVAAPPKRGRESPLLTTGPGKAGIFDVLYGMARAGLGGSIGGGKQYVSWIHERDFLRAIDWLIAAADVNGAINLTSPTPLPQREFMGLLRQAMGKSVGLPATKWMAEIGAFFLRTDTELLLKSRRVVPGRLLQAGFEFDFPSWGDAAADLVAQVRVRLS
jgi:uncharacterized protein